MGNSHIVTRINFIRLFLYLRNLIWTDVCARDLSYIWTLDKPLTELCIKLETIYYCVDICHACSSNTYIYKAIFYILIVYHLALFTKTKEVFSWIDWREVRKFNLFPVEENQIFIPTAQAQTHQFRATTMGPVWLLFILGGVFRPVHPEQGARNNKTF